MAAGGGGGGGPACVPEPDATLCSRGGRQCGGLYAEDNCGTSRTVSSCGGCAGSASCSGAGLCCTAESDGELCQRAAKKCGSLTTDDRCGRTRQIASCGACAFLDPAFGDGGVAIIQQPAGWSSTSLLPLADGGILIAGFGPVAGTRRSPWVERLTSSGAVDLSFGDAGTILLPGVFSPSTPRLAEIAGEQLVVAVGHTVWEGTVSAPHVMLVRLGPDGTLDSNFGDGGFSDLVAPPPGLLGDANAAGELLVRAGSYAAKLDRSGQQVASFGTAGGFINGTLAAPFSNDPTIPTKVYLMTAARFLGDAGVRTLGWTLRTKQNQQDLAWAMGHYSLEGKFDPTFGSGGMTIGPPILDSTTENHRQSVIASDGSAFVLAARYAAGSFDGVLVRLNAAGLPDPSFGAGGRAIVSLRRGNAGYELEPVSLMISRSGAPMIGFFGGVTGALWPLSFLVTKLGPGATPDPTFPKAGSGEGWAEISEPTSQWQDVTVTFAVQADDGVLVLTSFRRMIGGPLTIALYRISP